MTEDIRHFQVDVPQEELDDLRRRVAATRWPDRELVDDRSQGVQLATMQAPRRWAEKAYPNLIHSSRPPKGGHFAAWEQPALLSEEVRTAFRTLR
jgi:pimeloyl-ACP methyl ester carboxylesterase